jgi:hypothetical protein
MGDRTRCGFPDQPKRCCPDLEFVRGLRRLSVARTLILWSHGRAEVPRTVLDTGDAHLVPGIPAAPLMSALQAERTVFEGLIR